MKRAVHLCKSGPDTSFPKLAGLSVSYCNQESERAISPKSEQLTFYKGAVASALAMAMAIALTLVLAMTSP